MKITMLGVSGSGKTVYMSAMSELFFNSAINGYSIANREYSFESETFVNKHFSEINTLSSGRFPDGTSSSVIMPLELRYRGEKVMEIDWIDYRGGAIKELANGDNSSKNAEIYATLIASDIIMVFVDAAVLRVCKNDIVARSRVGAVEISQVLNWIMKRKYIDIVFILSKADSSIIDIEKDYATFKLRLENIYSRFFSESNTDISQYEIIPVGAVGCGNVNTEYSWRNKENEKVLVFNHKVSDIENMCTYNIASSFATVLLKSLESVMNQKNVNVYELENEVMDLQKNFGLTKNVIDILFNNSGKREKIYDLKHEIIINRRELLNLKPHKARLEEISLSFQ